MKNGKRRGATKVPNVILRPAPPTSHSTEVASTSSAQIDNSGPGELDFRAGSLPLREVILCATGNIDKVTLFAYAQDLGATRSNDFTDQVTHLIASEPGSAKYKCAVERNLPVLTENWLQDIHDAWLNGEEIDLNKSVAKHRLPIFTGVRLCITGMHESEARERIAETIKEHGGTCLKSLDPSCTHLLCSESTSEKITTAKQVNRGKSRKKVHLIWEEWFWDCVELDGRLDEELYNVDMPRRPRRRKAEPPESLNKQVTILAPATLPQQNPLPKSLPMASLTVDETEIGQTQKQKGIGVRVLRNVIRTRNSSQIEEEQTQVACDSLLSLSIETQIMSGESEIDSSGLRRETGSLLQCLSESRNASFATTSASPAISQPFTRHASATGSKRTEPVSTLPLSVIALVPQIFAGYRFRALGEAKEGTILRDAIIKHGGGWLDDDDLHTRPDIFLVRLVGGNNFCQNADEADRLKFRTECWVERSISEERMCAADEHIVFTPLKVTTPVEGSEKLSVSLSGLDSAETYWTKRLLRAVGANVLTAFSKSSSHLICPSGQGQKYQKAREWKIPVVNIGWLFHIASSGKIPPYRDFEVTNDDSRSVVNQANNSMLASDMKDNGKAVELEEREAKITDITNGNSQKVQPLNLKPPDPSRYMELEGTTSIKMADRPTVYHTLVPASTSSTGPLSPIQTGKGSVLAFGEPIALRNSGSFQVAENNDVLGCSLQSLHPSLPHEGVTTEQDLDNQPTQIPSSCSPSPLKDPGRTLSPSISETRGLRTAITALLGKRGLEPKTDQATTQKRPTKRPRSQNKAMNESDRPMPSLMSLVATSSPLTCLSPKEDDITMQEESVLSVIYEDPDQRDEKKRLIALFEKNTTDFENVNDEVTSRCLDEIQRDDPSKPKKKLTRRLNRYSGTKR